MDQKPQEKSTKPIQWPLVVFLALLLSILNVGVEKLLQMLGASLLVTEVVKLTVSLTLWILVTLYLIKKFSPRD